MSGHTFCFWLYRNLTGWFTENKGKGALMRNNLIFYGPLATCIGLISMSAQAQEDLEATVRSFIGIIGQAIVNDLDDNLQREREQQSGLPGILPYVETGYCQVWRDGILAVQQRCNVRRECAPNGSCNLGLVWPNGGVTTLTVQENRQLAINGMPTETVQIGTDTCIIDHDPQNAFCYTKEPQSASSRLQGPAIPNIEDVLSTAPSSERPAERNNDKKDSVDELIVAFKVLAEDNSESAEIRQQRCQLGTKLFNENREDLSDEDKEFIRDQFYIDECFD